VRNKLNMYVICILYCIKIQDTLLLNVSVCKQYSLYSHIIITPIRLTTLFFMCDMYTVITLYFNLKIKYNVN